MIPNGSISLKSPTTLPTKNDCNCSRIWADLGSELSAKVKAAEVTARLDSTRHRQSQTPVVMCLSMQSLTLQGTLLVLANTVWLQVASFASVWHVGQLYGGVLKMKFTVANIRGGMIHHYKEAQMTHCR